MMTPLLYPWMQAQAYFRHRTFFAHVNNGHYQRIASVGRLYDVDS